jgi:hypothetical protein
MTYKKLLVILSRLIRGMVAFGFDPRRRLRFENLPSKHVILGIIYFDILPNIIANKSKLYTNEIIIQ